MGSLLSCHREAPVSRASSNPTSARKPAIEHEDSAPPARPSPPEFGFKSIEHIYDFQRVYPDPIFFAAAEGDIKEIERLISQSHSPNTKGALGNTPLHIACNFRRKGALGALLVHGGNPDQRNEKGKTVFMIAKELWFETKEEVFLDIMHMITHEDWTRHPTWLQRQAVIS
ncbi:hypothetical protein TWF694_008391 [Orbilia ellipsospora]|uniref:Ankyrin repeat protein n=1 Tax=Orbilia ellipsospora TaxID=2528407 RepID=A0AAV9XFY0_9PEZI